MKQEDYAKEYREAEKMIILARKKKFQAIKGLMILGLTYTAIGKMFGVSEQAISNYYKNHS